MDTPPSELTRTKLMLGVVACDCPTLQIRTPMTSREFKARVLPLIEEELKRMPCMWQTENNANNAWDMLIEMWPDDEPGMGLWDRIRDVILAWICGVLEEQPNDDIKEYWEENADHDDFYYDNREQVDEHGAAAWFPPHREMCEDITEEFWDDVLTRAEHEGDRRREEKETFDSTWDLPREVLETLADVLKDRRPSAESDSALCDAIDQWIGLCSAVPFSWPPAVPSLRLDEVGAGTLRLRLTYEGSRMELLAAIPSGDLFIPPSEWERSFSLCASGVVGIDYNEHFDRLATGGANEKHDFTVSLDFPPP